MAFDTATQSYSHLTPVEHHIIDDQKFHQPILASEAKLLGLDPEAYSVGAQPLSRIADPNQLHQGVATAHVGSKPGNSKPVSCIATSTEMRKAPST